MHTMYLMYMYTFRAKSLSFESKWLCHYQEVFTPCYYNPMSITGVDEDVAVAIVDGVDCQVLGPPGRSGKMLFLSVRLTVYPTSCVFIDLFTTSLHLSRSLLYLSNSMHLSLLVVKNMIHYNCYHSRNYLYKYVTSTQSVTTSNFVRAHWGQRKIRHVSTRVRIKVYLISGGLSPLA